MIDKKSLFWQLAWKVAVLCLITFIVGCFFTDPWVWGAGVLLGFVFTVLRLKWMDYSVQKAVTGDPAKASGYMTRSYFARYALSIGVLVLAALVPQISLYSTMIAMFTLKIATFVQGFFEKKAPKDGSVQFEEWIDEDEEEEVDEQWDRWETYNLRARKRLAKKEGGSIRRNKAEATQPSVEEHSSVEEEASSFPEEPNEEDDSEQLSLFD